MTYNAILADLKRKVYKPVYFLQGDEPYYIDAISDYISKNVLDDAEKEFNQSVVYGQDVSPEDIVSMARRFPMMARYQVIIVREAQNWKKPDGLLPLLEKPVDSTILVICYKGKKLDKRLSVWKMLSKVAATFDSEKIKDYKVNEWVTDYCRERGLSIEPRAAALLGDFLGNDIGKLVNALDRLQIILDKDGTIKAGDVTENIGINKDFNVFELRKALGERNVKKALLIANYFANNQKEHHIIPTIYNLYTFFVQIIRYHYCPNKTDNKAVASAVGVNPYFVQDVKNAAATYPKTTVMEAMAVLHDIDLKTKGVGATNAESGELMRELISKLVRI